MTRERAAVEIRSARPSEVATVAAVVQAAYCGYVGRIGREPAPMLADYAHLVAQGVVFVVAQDDQVRGVLVLIPGPDNLLLENVAVHPLYQGQGLGTALLTFVEEQAQAAGVSEVRLYTNELMTENIAFYGRRGYEETARRDVEGYHRVFMRKVLANTTSSD